MTDTQLRPARGGSNGTSISSRPKGLVPSSISSNPPSRVPELAILVGDAQSGDETAFAALVARFGSRTARRIVKDPDDAADVVQQTWLILFRHIGTIEEPDRLPAWLVTTARREALQVVRKRARTLLVDDRSLNHIADAAESLEAYVVREDLRQRVREALRQLPPERALLLLHVVAHGESYREAAHALGRPQGSLGPLRTRYLRELSGAFERCGGVAA